MGSSKLVYGATLRRNAAPSVHGIEMGNLTRLHHHKKLSLYVVHDVPPDVPVCNLRRDKTHDATAGEVRDCAHAFPRPCFGRIRSARGQAGSVVRGGPRWEGPPPPKKQSFISQKTKNKNKLHIQNGFLIYLEKHGTITAADQGGGPGGTAPPE